MRFGNTRGNKTKTAELYHRLLYMCCAYYVRLVYTLQIFEKMVLGVMTYHISKWGVIGKI